MKPWNELIWDGNFILSVSTHHATLTLQGIIIRLYYLALFDNKFIFLGFLRVWICLLSLHLSLNHLRLLLDFELTDFFRGMNCLNESSWLVGHWEFVIFQILIKIIEAITNPCINLNIHAIIFFIIILEFMPSSSRKSYSVSVHKQLPSIPKLSILDSSYTKFFR